MNTTQDSEHKKKIFQFICKYTNDIFIEGEDINLKFLLDNVITSLFQEYYSLQEEKSFKFTLKKLVDIIVFNLEYDCCIQTLVASKHEYEDLLQDFPNFGELEKFFSGQDKIKLKDPIVVGLTDQLEDLIELDAVTDQDLIEKKLQDIKQILLKPREYSVLQQINAISVLKKISKIYTEEIKYWSQGYQFEATKLQEAIAKFYETSNQSAIRDSLMPFAVYQMKLFYQQFSILSIQKTLILQMNEWITQYTALALSEESIELPYLKDDLLISFQKNAFDKLPQVVEEVPAKLKEKTLKKFGQTLAIIDFFYLKPQSPDNQPLQNDNFFQKEAQLLQNPVSKTFLQTFINPDLNPNKRGKFILINSIKDANYYFKMVQILMGSAAVSSEQSFFFDFLANTTSIKDYYVPFVQNFKDFYYFQAQEKCNKRLAVLKCSRCQALKIAINLNENKVKSIHPIHRIGDFYCKNKELNQECGGILEERNIDIKAFLESINEMQKGYIPYDMQSYHKIQIRSLNTHELAVGRIILHSLLMVCLLFSQYENDILSTINGQQYNGKEYIKFFERAKQQLTNYFQSDWEYLKQLLNLNDTKILQLVNYVIVQMLYQIQAFDAKNLQTPIGRLNIETKFKEICKDIFSDINTFFAAKIGVRSDLEEKFLELNKIGTNDFYNLLRMQTNISISQFENHVKNLHSDETQFFKILFEQKESIQSIRHLKPLINWAKYIMNSWNAELTYDEVNDLSIGEIIQKENKNNKKALEYMQKIERDFIKFRDAWNSFAGLIIRDKKPNNSNEQVEVIIPEISLESKVKLCCLTTDNFEQEGFIFYMLLKYLALKQVHVLNEAEKLYKKEENQIYSIKFPSSTILNLKKDAIILFRENRQLKHKRKLTNLNMEESNEMEPVIDSEQDLNSLQPNAKPEEAKFEKEKFEQVIILNSSSNLQYGRGKEVEYDMEMIKTNSIDLLLKGKYLIIFEDKLNFQYVNMGNLYSQVAEIISRIPQTHFQHTKMIVNSIQSDYDIYDIYQEFLTVMNFLFQSPEDASFNLILYFQKYKLHKFETFLNNDHFAKELQLTHIIDIFDTLEHRIFHMLIGNVNDTFTTELTQKQERFLQFALQEETFILKPFKNAVARLCVRMLSGNQTMQNPKKSLLQMLFHDDSSRQLLGKSSGLDIEIAEIVISQCDLLLEHAKALYHSLKQIKDRLGDSHVIGQGSRFSGRLFTQSIDTQSLHESSSDVSRRISVLDQESSMVQIQIEEEVKESFLRQSVLDTNSRIYEQFEEEIQTDRTTKTNKGFDPEKLLYEFLILGPNTSQLEEYDLEKHEQDIIVEPQIKYLHAEKHPTTQNPKKLQVQQFCFPGGVTMKKATPSQIQKFLSNQNYTYSKKNSFIFTIRTDEDGQTTQQQLHYYCLCIVKDELMEIKVGKKRMFYLTQRAFVVMSLHKYFDFHLQVLNSILCLYKIKRMKLQSELRNVIFSDFDRDVEATIRMPLITEEIHKLLQSYFKLKPKQQSKLDISMPSSERSIHFEIPKQQIQLELNDLYWYAPQFLQVVNSDQFFQILSAILQEKSIIFIADSLPMLSSACIGIQCFLEPFQWPHAQIPILPKQLLEITASPVPFIVGIQRSIKSEVQFDEITSEAVLVDIQYNKVELTHIFNERATEPSFNNLKAKLYPYISRLNNEEKDFQLDGKEMKETLRKIYDLVKYTLKYNLVYKMPLEIIEGRLKYNTKEQLEEDFVNRVDELDKEFARKFVQTMMFGYYVDQKNFVSVRASSI